MHTSRLHSNVLIQRQRLLTLNVPGSYEQSSFVHSLKIFLWAYAFISFAGFLRRVDAVPQSKCARETVSFLRRLCYFTRPVARSEGSCFRYNFSRSRCSLWLSNGVLLMIQHDYTLYNDQTRYLAFPSPRHFAVFGAFYLFCSSSSQSMYVLVNCAHAGEHQNSVLLS